MLVFLIQMLKQVLLISLIVFLFIEACQKDSIITSPDAKIDFSADTIEFDTVFSSTGSITQSFKIKNLNDQKLILTTIRLMGGSNSVFKININGAAQIQSNNVEMAANDSLYIFVTVYIDPTTNNLPFILQDSIQVSYNGIQTYVQLQAWGQNAHFLKNAEITSNTVWNNALPYVILGSLHIDSSATLTMAEGCKIFCHANAPILVDGTLIVRGSKYDSTRVSFQSDRLDPPYNNFPGSWPGIYFSASSANNSMEYALVKNAYRAIVVQDPAINVNPKLILKECIVDNAFNVGILGLHTSIQAINCLVSNCGNNVVLTYGGNYDFIHCTLVGYSNAYIPQSGAVLTLSNYLSDGSGILEAGLTSQFTNCIFWGESGTIDNEVELFKQGDSSFNSTFANCVWKAKAIPSIADTSLIILNQDPLFQLIDNQNRFYDFRLKAGSPAIDQGLNLGINIDLDGNPRPVNLPDLGAYERQ